MTHHHSGAGAPAPNPYWGVTPVPRPRRWPWVVVALALIATIGMCIAAAAAGPGGDKTAAVGAVSSTSSSRSNSDGVRPLGDRVQPVGAALGADDVTLSIRKTSNQCFGSAGCLVEYRVTATLDHEPPADDEYLVTYEVRGVQDGPLVDTFTLYGATYDVPNGSAQTKRQGTKLTAVVTTVEKL